MTGAKEIIADDYKDSLWGKFLLETIRLDIYHEKPKGWHWFCAFRDLAGSDLEQIQQTLPEEHPLKSITPTQSFLVPELTDAIVSLKNALSITGNIKEIDFSELGFENIYFYSFVFPIKVSFRNAVFYGSANFENVLFFGNSHLSKPNRVYTSATNAESVDFKAARFTSTAIFTNARFSESVNFSDAVFIGEASFKKAIFDTIALFSGVEFHFLTYFMDAKFFNTTGFSRTKFLSGVNFANATFVHGVSFANIKTASSATFTKTRFMNRVPLFYDADLHSNTIWDWDVNLWPQIDWSNINDNDKGRMIDNQDAYENLSSQMKGLDKYHDEHFFYRQEMRCRRWLTRYPAKCFYWLYEKLSDYGYGIKQALLWWLAHLAVGMFAIAILSLINSWLECWKDGAWETTKSALCSIPLSFANAHGFLPFYKGALSGCYKYFMYDNYFNTIWALQTVLGILFLFLLVLTVRIRFRLK